MAQMTRTPLARALGLLLMAAAGNAWAQPPEDALAAEMRQDWAAAAQSYRAHLRQTPDDAGLWQRLADVEARRGRTAEAAQALGRAAALRPDDAALQADHAHALAAAGDRAGALAAIDRAAALRPDDVDLLLDRARLANWNGDYAQARASLERVHALDPSRDVEADIARASAWQGDLDDAVARMRAYLAQHPDARAERLDLARFLAWRGAYAEAAAQLDTYDTRWPGDVQSQALRARILAWAGWWHGALALNGPLRAAGTDDYDARYTQALALRQSFEPRRALPEVEAAQRLRPDAKATHDLARSTRPRVRSHLALPLQWSSDSDHIDIRQAGLGLAAQVGERSALLADATQWRYGVRGGSPFVAADGSRHVDERRVRVGWRQALGADAAIEGWLGSDHAGHGGGSRGVGTLELLAAPDDRWQGRLGVERERVGVSPRAVSLGVMRNGVHVEARWRPDLAWTVDLSARHDRYSDANDRDELAVAVRRAVVRNGHISLDLGAAGQAFGFSRDPGDGYYAPDRYRRVAATAGLYWHIDDDTGLGVQAALGMQRDEHTHGWKSANDLGVDFTAGIFADWQLHLRAGYTQRRQASGGYDGRVFGLDLERRF